jgi:5-methylcytosine-specific restriction protein A
VERVKRIDYYRALDNVYGRGTKTEERRPRNISYALQLMGRDWIPGLTPQYVGPNPATQIETAIAAAEGRAYEGIAVFELAVEKAARY